jgi:hypothetical protein
MMSEYTSWEEGGESREDMRNEDTEELRQMARCNINIGYPLSLLIP